MTSASRAWYGALSVALVLGLVLRLHGVHDPILDHPGWRQGDTAAIARNFATLDLNPFHPQTDYDGPPPNYVELELQIVPFLAALGYKLFGIHEIFGRLISIAFSLGTVVVVGYFARALFASAIAGGAAAFAFAVYPGAFYYGRTFTPDTTMAFFLAAALYATYLWLERDGVRPTRRFAIAAALAAAAILAKPVASVELVPIAAMLLARRDRAAVLRSPATYAFFALAIAPYAAYDTYVRAIAEWHWASGITALHVVPALRKAFASAHGFAHQLGLFRSALGMLPGTMLGLVGTLLFVVAIVVPVRRDARPLLYGWLLSALAYAYVVVTVERVDYYLYPFLPLAALWTGGLVATLFARARSPLATRVGLVAAVAVLAVAVASGRRAVAPYYVYSKTVYRTARALDATLPPGSLVVMGHYDPSVLYYIDRKGWEEDPYLWTPFDEQSAIRKGARSFVAIENNRLKRNVELAAWLARFPVTNPNATWPVYETDPAKILPGAEAKWRAFRDAEKNRRLAPVRGTAVPPS